MAGNGPGGAVNIGAGKRILQPVPLARWPISGRRALVYGATRVGGKCWDSVESSWTPWDMIDNLHRADQACLEVTDATRTAAGFDRA
jgi:hypothetical protein